MSSDTFKPIEVKDGFASVKIYRCVNNKDYFTYAVTWWSEGKRHRRAIADLTEARREARRIAKELADGRHSMTEITVRDLAYYKDLEKKMGGVPLHEAVQLWLNVASKKVSAVLTKDVIEEILKTKNNDDFVGGRQKTNLRLRLNKFGQEFGPRVISTIKAKEIDAFLSNPEWAARTKAHYRQVILMLFDYAKRKEYLDPDRDHQADKTEVIRVQESKLESWSVPEMRTLLQYSNPKTLPWIVLGAFAGVRSAEIERMNWEDIDWNSNLILVHSKRVGTGKVRAQNDRTIPMTENLKSWLSPFRTFQGNILKSLSVKNIYEDLDKIVGLIRRNNTDFQWKPNANRHSFATYYLALTGDASQTALACGHNPSMLLRRYKTIMVNGRTVTREMAKEYFSLAPGAVQPAREITEAKSK
jgi:integrase